MVSQPSEGKEAAVTVGRTDHHCGDLSSAAFYHEQSSAHKSGQCTGTLLTSDLTKQRTCHHLLGYLRGHPGISKPFHPPRESLLALFGSQAATAQTPLFLCHFSEVFLLHCNHSPSALARTSLIHLTYHSGTLLIPAFSPCYSKVPATAPFAIPKGHQDRLPL